VLFEEATERAGSSPLNDEKRKGTYIARRAICPYLKASKNLKAVLVGLVFLMLYRARWTQKLTLNLYCPEPNTTAHAVWAIMAMCLMMGLSQRV
jgi:hypothetical protein